MLYIMYQVLSNDLIKLIIRIGYAVLLAMLTLQNGSSPIIGERHSSSSVSLVKLKEYSNPDTNQPRCSIVPTKKIDDKTSSIYLGLQ